MLKDDELLTFDRENLAHGEELDAAALLAEHGEVYRAQLVGARWLDNWVEGLEKGSGALDPEYESGFIAALRDVAAHLRQGDLVPGGTMYRDLMGEE